MDKMCMDSIEYRGTDPCTIFALSGLVFGEVIGYSLERLFWLPWHVWVGCAVFTGIAFHKTVARHVEVIGRVFVVRRSRRDKREHKSAIYAHGVEYTQHISEFTCLQALVAHIIAIQLQWHCIKIHDCPTHAACILGTLIGTAAKLAYDDWLVAGEVPFD